MMSRRFEGLFILVEGLSDDRFYQSFFSADWTRFIPAGGKYNVFEALLLLEDRPDVIGIVDADFGEQIPEGLPVFVTDTHDHETLIIRSPAFEKFLRHFFDQRKLERFLEPQRQDTLRGLLLDAGQTLGYVRMASQRFRYNLPMQHVDFSRFVTPEELEIDLRQLYHTLQKLNPPRLPPFSQLRKDLKGLRREGHDPWRVVRGHDLTRLLSVLLNGQPKLRAFSSPTSQDAIEAMLRTSFELRFLQDTDLYRAIQAWGRAHWDRPIFAE